ncbi:hypothetical protein QO002_005248 [Pararhizobium capsulatum DSM 1112]|uniref:Uncharacterized protein n=1 Tax=Pararhizobium capsulatum DSM 1112 TaxID=1121113 RepID=A0ABU0BYM9_9HYPH|nr:hypothetical protein [Pararhizobium capsulatum]MDQ0323042.1 hypothetical protein [Pararhizobium capsulatum DSM 1112]
MNYGILGLSGGFKPIAEVLARTVDEVRRACRGGVGEFFFVNNIFEGSGRLASDKYPLSGVINFEPQIIQSQERAWPAGPPDGELVWCIAAGGTTAIAVQFTTYPGLDDRITVVRCGEPPGET